MENATKALLIAASVLIAILLIAVGMRVFNSTQGTVNASKDKVETAEVRTFNSQFEQYVGTRSASEVKSLINLVLASNAKEDKQVNLYVKGSLLTSMPTEYMNNYIQQNIESNTQYKVLITSYENGYVSDVRVNIKK